jgi:outer membrane protein assembly factor BamB
MRSRLALGLAVALAPCSDGGSSGSTIPTVPWANFRHDNSNSAVSGTIQRNEGNPQLLFATADGTITLSTPAIDRNGHPLLGTDNGVVSLDQDGDVRWTFEGYSTAEAPDTPCTACALGTPGCVPVGRVTASPTVSPGNTIVFGTDGADGRLFAIEDRQQEADCNWIFPAADAPGLGFRSSAAVLINSLDLSLQSVFVGADDGVLRGLNADGSVRWSVATAGPITASPTLDGNLTTYVTTADGVIPAVSFSGVPVPNPISIGRPPDAPFQQSPAASISLYAVGSGGSLFGITPPAQPKWQFTRTPPVDSLIRGSPAFVGQSFSQQAETTFDTIVYVVDTTGTAFGVRDSNGMLLQLQRCTEDLTQDCRTQSCDPEQGECGDNGRCSIDTEQSCTRDSCMTNGNGTCIALPTCENPPQATGCCNIIVVPSAPATTIPASPILSGDLFVVVGTSDGRVCARTLDNFVPGQTLDNPTETWRDGNGCITLDPTLDPTSPEAATRSSPIIGENGRIYVTTDAGLWVIE